VAFLPGGLVDEGHAGGFALRADGHLARHRVGENVEISRGQGGTQMNGLRIVVRTNRATAMAIRRPETWGTGPHVIGENALRLGIAGMQLGRQPVRILWLGQHRAMDRGHVCSGFLAVLLGIEFADPQLRCRQHTRR